METPFFSIIVPDFYGSVSSSRRLQCIESLLRSTWVDFEILLYHDGPAPQDIEKQYEHLQAMDGRIRPVITKVRFNDWGHSLRDIGLGEARGKYIIHLNADNVLYPHSMSEFYAYSKRPRYELPVSASSSRDQIRNHVFNPDVLIYAVKMMGMMNVLASPLIMRLPGNELNSSLILPGWPPAPGRIDAMQMVATRDIWLSIGGWHDKSEASDGVLLSSIAQVYGYYVIPEILGEHW